METPLLSAIKRFPGFNFSLCLTLIRSSAQVSDATKTWPLSCVQTRGLTPQGSRSAISLSSPVTITREYAPLTSERALAIFCFHVAPGAVTISQVKISESESDSSFILNLLSFFLCFATSTILPLCPSANSQPCQLA